MARSVWINNGTLVGPCKSEQERIERIKKSMAAARKRHYHKHRKEILDAAKTKRATPEGKQRQREANRRYREKKRNTPEAIAKRLEYQKWLTECKIAKEQKAQQAKEARIAKRKTPEQKRTDRIAYRKAYRQTPRFKVVRAARRRLYKILKNKRESLAHTSLIGCSPEQLCRHLESKFSQGMSWDNYGKWHIDHIIPCAAFDLSVKEQREKCFHYSNLQPLWADDNIAKGANLQ